MYKCVFCGKEVSYEEFIKNGILCECITKGEGDEKDEIRSEL